MIVNRTFMALILTVSLVSCSLFSGADRDAYKKSKRVKLLEEPPEIVLPKRDASFDIPNVEQGTVSKKANDQEVAPNDTTEPESNPTAVPDSPFIGLQRDGSLQWLSVEAVPEVLWQRLLTFWKDSQVKVIESNSKQGTIKTDWIVSKAGLVEKKAGNNIFVGGSNGDLILRDQFRMRLERAEVGSSVFISHVGAEKTKDSDGSEQWKLRPVSPELEAEMLTRLQQYLAQP